MADCAIGGTGVISTGRQLDVNPRVHRIGVRARKRKRKRNEKNEALILGIIRTSLWRRCREVTDDARKGRGATSALKLLAFRPTTLPQTPYPLIARHKRVLLTFKTLSLESPGPRSKTKVVSTLIFARKDFPLQPGNEATTSYLWYHRLRMP
jgi:hypothetical protein